MNNDAGGLLDLHVIAAIINRHLIAIVAAILIVLGLTAVALYAAPRLYTATSTVALDRSSADLMKVGVDNDGVTIDSSSVETEVQVLQSPVLAEAVVKQLKLDKNSSFVGAVTDPVLANRRAVDLVRNGLDVKRGGTSYAIAIGYTSPDPQLAASIVNAMAEAYVGRQKEDKAGVRTSEIKELSDRMGKLRQDVIDAETAVAQYRAATNLVDITKDRTSTQQELSVLNTELASARADQAAADARAAATRTGTTTNLLQNPVVNGLVARQAQLRQERNDLAGRYGDKHPALASIDRQLSEITNSIAAETSRVRTSVNSEAQIARQRASSIAGSINRAQGALVAGNNASVRLAELERNAESSRQLYQTFLDRYRGALATQGTEQSKSYIIARALTPSVPSSPNKPAFILAGALAAVIMAAAVAFILEVLERGFRSRAELESGLSIPVLSSIPDVSTIKDESGVNIKAPLHLADHLVTHPDSIFTESFRGLRTALRAGKSGEGPKSVVITSSIADEGKTTIGICLARSSAIAGLSVVLVDCDLRRRASSRNLTESLKAGLVEVLKNTASLDNALVRDSASGVMLLPQREAAGADYDIIDSPAMKSLIDTLKQRFDLVILDGAPVLPVAEARAIAAMADATVLVVRWRKTPTGAAEMALRELTRSKANVVGTVLAKVDVSRRGAGNEAYYYKPYTPALGA